MISPETTTKIRSGWTEVVSKMRAKSNWSYCVDYAIVLGFMILFTIVDKTDPFHQHFSLENYTLQYPFATKERVPVSLLVFLCLVVPAIIIAIYTFLIDGIYSHQPRKQPGASRRRGPYTRGERWWQFHMGFLGLMLSVSAAFTITGSLKNAIGKPRPDLIDRCRPKNGSKDAPVFGLSSIEICTQTDQHILQDGFRSFPSGHSSCSFAGLYYLSLFLAGKLHVLDSRGEVWKTLIVMIPTLAAAVIAGTRIMDARHHPFDVIFGSLMGVVVAWGAYRQYFPAISDHHLKGRAYDKRTWGNLPSGIDSGTGSIIGYDFDNAPHHPDHRQADQSRDCDPRSGTAPSIPAPPPVRSSWGQIDFDRNRRLP